VLPGTQVEVCDTLDNDCDGAADEGNPGGGAGCVTGEPGICAAGTVTCSAGALVCVQNLAAVSEVCNALDDDCDGASDDGLGETTCGLGVCLHTVDNCVGGSAQVCDAFQGASAEICDGLDNDCDGADDDGLSTDADGDGYTAPGSCLGLEDCDDANPAVQAGNTCVGGAGIVSDPTGNVTLDFPTITSGGETTLSIGPCDTAIPAGIVLPPSPECLDVETTATWSGQVEVCWTYDEADFPNENSISMWRCPDPAPEPPALPCYELPQTTHDLVANEICALTDGFSEFFLARESNLDGDPTPDSADNCPTVFNLFPTDSDADGAGNACDTCPAVANPRVEVPASTRTYVGGQIDDDADGLGNACDFDYDQTGPVILAADFNEMKASVGKLAGAATGCGISGTRRCGIFDHDGIGAPITAADFNRAKASVGSPKPASCGAACTPPFGAPDAVVIGKVVCEGPAC
jgi:hypothetical protein